MKATDEDVFDRISTDALVAGIYATAQRMKPDREGLSKALAERERFELSMGQ